MYIYNYMSIKEAPSACPPNVSSQGCTESIYLYPRSQSHCHVVTGSHLKALPVRKSDLLYIVSTIAKQSFTLKCSLIPPHTMLFFLPKQSPRIISRRSQYRGPRCVARHDTEILPALRWLLSRTVSNVLERQLPWFVLDVPLGGIFFSVAGQQQSIQLLKEGSCLYFEEHPAWRRWLELLAHYRWLAGLLGEWHVCWMGHMNWAAVSNRLVCA